MNSAELPSDRYLPARITRRADIADTHAVFWIELEEPLSFQAGQYLTLGAHSGESWVLRPYSIASAPHENPVELTVELVDHGALTPLLWTLAEGDSVCVRRKAVGRLLFQSELSLHLFVATGTGIAPFVSMIRDRLHRPDAYNGEIVLLHGSSTSEVLHPYLDELRTTAQEPWLTYVPTISRPWNEPEWPGEVGRVDDLVRKYLDQMQWTPGDVAAYLCGHPDMIDHVASILQRGRLEDEAILREQYYPSPSK